ncbi:hypothetical protein [Dactylosporangium sp. NPDC051484]|uniref:hypothetical protein n=1 Tax=Dactylosporangium sp. NPDC051484 TaxID=3154942 RepID=UPI00344ED795
MDFAKHASSFGAAAALYDRIRPRYPEAALRWALGDEPRAIVDLGAGTGILTPSWPNWATASSRSSRTTKCAGRSAAMPGPATPPQFRSAM